MREFTIKSPCSPGDIVYTIDGNGSIRQLYVTQLQIVQSGDDIDLAICFAQYPYMLVDEAWKKLYRSYEEAKIAFKNSI